ncbi:DMT family transporter [Paracoccus albus]|uniref:DMT family transporter n=1 Tax=Paracoccus albus TaxID=3017784 RepID=UPI0022EFF50A|nr:DMT family transporter [Paracoccus albus]WBU61122.1 DMT family transporter [Paracoccus albus]
MDARQRSDLAGIGWMVLTGILFVLFNALVKMFGQGLPAAQSAFIRFAFGIILVAPVLLRVPRQGFAKGLTGLFVLRAALHVCGVILWFYAMTRIPIAEVTAINFLNPIVATIGGVLILREAISWRRGVAILIALFGAMIVLRPGMRGLDNGHLAQVLASVSMGLSYLVARRLAQSVRPEIVVAIMTLSVAAGLAPLAFAVWVPPSGEQVLGLSLCAVVATAAHYAMTRAFAVAPLNVTQPVTFLQLVWASILGLAVFQEPLDPMVLLGGTMMIASLSYITWREARIRPAPSEEVQIMSR